MKNIVLRKRTITPDNPFFIAEIGHNHQGSLETAVKMVKHAALNGVDAVKFQKRNNKALFTKAFYNKPYENENSYGKTYGEHREFLEFGENDFLVLMKTAEEYEVEFMCTAFDRESVDFLEKLGIGSYKVASADVTNTPLLRYIAATKKPVVMSTGASTIEEIRGASDIFNNQGVPLVILHCVAGYPTEYKDLNLRVIESLRDAFPDNIIGYSGHDNGILAPSLAYMLGARVFEKHFTLNRAWKGTDHKFSLEPEGLRKQVRDLHRINESLGDPKKYMQPFEVEARKKMGKSIYTKAAIKAGTKITEDHLAFKSPAGGLEPYRYLEVVGKVAARDLAEEEQLSLGDLK